MNNQTANSNGIDTYSLGQPSGTRFDQSPGARFFVMGTAAVDPVPEPATLGMAGTAVLFGLIAHRRHVRGRRAA